MLSLFSGKQSGFTLIEVMAAVAVFAVSATGLYALNQQSIFLAQRLESKTFAHWVALNSYAEMEMLRTLPEIGTESDKQEMAGAEWKVTREVYGTPVNTVRRVSVEVSLGEGAALARVEGYLGQRTVENLNDN